MMIAALLVAGNPFPDGTMERRVESPNASISVEVSVNSEGTPELTISFGGVTVLPNSRLGLVRGDGDFSRALQLISVSSTESSEDKYLLRYGKRMRCTYRSNRKDFRFENADGKKIDIVVQVSNDGVAFRYVFPGEPDGIRRTIRDELTYFNFDDHTRAWIQPMAPAKSGWNAVNPCYEEYYVQDESVVKLPNNEPGWAFPALFHLGKYWIALTETAPDRDYCGCRLMHDSTSTGFKIGFPQELEVFPGGPANPESQLPWRSPWRIIALADNLGTLIESTLGTDLAAPSMLPNPSFVRPGRSSWSWVLFKDDSTTYSVQKRFIDYASDMGWEYCLIDADWDRKIGYERLGALCEYALSKGVSIFAWYNSAGEWNTTPYTPRDKLLTRELRDAEFKRLKEIGVKGVKADFFGGDGQSMMSYYQDIFEDAARYQLMVNCHGSTIPRGWQRTYPNLVAMEAIRGFEYVTFEQGNADREASHCAVLPFARNLFDPMDFTPVCFSEVPGIQKATTNSFELALSVLFVSGVQHFAEVPEGMGKVPREVRQILMDVPVAWDETRFVDGYPGRYVIVARRKGGMWYVAGINGEPKARTVQLDLGFVGTPTASLLVTCGPTDRSFEVRKQCLEITQPLRINLRANDGFLCRIRTAAE
jgi:alpha-glucosidase